jgi:hypothetical protein
MLYPLIYTFGLTKHYAAIINQLIVMVV